MKQSHTLNPGIRTMNISHCCYFYVNVLISGRKSVWSLKNCELTLLHLKVSDPLLKGDKFTLR